jgi:tetratricopeptide (TPR) repeat protein
VKKNAIALILLCIIQQIGSAQTITLTQPPNGGNQKSSVSQWMGLGSVTVTYRGPDVHDNAGKDRRGSIWGNIVHYGFEDMGFGTSVTSPWRAGANEITTIQFSHPMRVNGKSIPAGTYGLMLATDSLKPWTWIFSSTATSWGTYYYNAEEDMLRVTASPEKAPYTEWLTYSFEQRQAASCFLWLNWEDKRIGFNIELPAANDLYVTKMKEELVGYAGFDARNWVRAAKFCLDSMVQLEKGLWFINRAMDTMRMNGMIDANSLRIKYELALELKRIDDAEQCFNQMNNLIGIGAVDFFVLGRNILKRGDKERAGEIFRFNKHKFPEEKYWTNLGMALLSSASGNKKEAIEYWELVIKHTPPERKNSIKEYEAEIQKLKI